MQLKRKTSIRKALGVATGTLLTSVPLAQHAVAAETDLSASQLYYSEEDRVTVHKTQLNALREIQDEETVKVNFIYDTMTGASPNGRVILSDAALADTPDEIPITTASGFSYSTTNTQDIAAFKPWLTSFKDTRIATALEWARTWVRNFRTKLGASGSWEDDYTSYGGSGQVELDINQKRTTLVAAAALNLDTVSPKGGIPDGMAQLWCDTNLPDDARPFWADCDQSAVRYKPGEKTVTDYLLGVTQVWNKHTLVQMNYSYGQNQGYLTDPYKLVSMLYEDTTDVVEPILKESVIFYEKRPRTREMQRVYWKLVYVTEREVLNASYRYFWDDWGVTAHTVDLSFRIDFLPRHFLEPHFRLHRQTQADFYRENLRSDDVEPAYVSADQRLGALDAATIGIMYGFKMSADSEINFRLEQMQQNYRSSELSDMKVLIAQFIFSSKF